MRTRAAQLACLLLLLTSVSAAESTARRAEFSLGGHYIGMLLLQSAAVAPPESPLSRQLDEEEAAALPAAPLAARTSSPSRPAAAHCVRVHSVTGSGL